MRTVSIQHARWIHPSDRPSSLGIQIQQGGVASRRGLAACSWGNPSRRRRRPESSSPRTPHAAHAGLPAFDGAQQDAGASLLEGPCPRLLLLPPGGFWVWCRSRRWDDGDRIVALMPAACLRRAIVHASPQPASPPPRLASDDVHPPQNLQVLTASAYTGLPPAPSQQQQQQQQQQQRQQQQQQQKQQKEPGTCPLGPNTSSGSSTSFLPLEPTTCSNMSSRARCVRDLGRV